MSEAVRVAKEDFGPISGAFKRVKLRKAPPEWSFPAGIWRMLFWPGEFRRQRRTGVGGGNEEWNFDAIKYCLLFILVSIRLHMEAPLIWHCSQAFTLSKGNGKADCQGVRLVHSLDSFGKIYYKCLWRANPDLSSYANRGHAYGYMKRRRREGAVLVQSLCGERLRESKLSFFSTFYDATNAFHSVEHWLLKMFVKQHASPFAAALLGQRLDHGQMSLECVDGILEVALGSGTLPGDTVAPVWFLGVYHWCLDGYMGEDSPGLSVRVPWLKHCLGEDEGARIALCAWADRAIDISFTSFADDLCRTQLLRSCEGFVRLSAANLERLQDRLAIGG
eukprot:2533256-Pyramimonas_sp.AAC.1